MLVLVTLGLEGQRAPEADFTGTVAQHIPENPSGKQPNRSRKRRGEAVGKKGEGEGGREPKSAKEGRVEDGGSDWRAGV